MWNTFHFGTKKDQIKTSSRGGSSVNTDYVKVPIFPQFVDNFPDVSPIILPDFI